jgi:hypothetical protein
MSEFPGASIRVCQFHIAQAVGRADFFGDEDVVKEKARLAREKTDGAKKRLPRVRVAVSLRARKDIFLAFQKIQRYRATDEKPFEYYREIFVQDLREALQKHGLASSLRHIVRYFDKYWFSDLWRGNIY